MFFQNFWAFNNMAAIQIDKLLEKEDSTIEDFFYQENFLSEQKQCHQKFALFMMKQPEYIKTLIDYCYLQNVPALLKNQENASRKKKIEDLKEKKEKEKEDEKEENKDNDGNNQDDDQNQNQNQSQQQQEQEKEEVKENYDDVQADKVEKMKNKFPFFASEILNEDGIPQLAAFLFGKFDPYNPDSESNSVIEKFSNKDDDDDEEIMEDINNSEESENTKKEKDDKENQEKQDKEDKEKRLQEYKKIGDEILEKIFSFLLKDPETTENYDTCAIYFSKIVLNLINENNDIFNYLEQHPQIVQRLQEKIQNKSIAEVLARLIAKDITQKQNNYLQKKIEMTRNLFTLLQNLKDSEVEALENIVLILMELIQCIVNYKNQPNTINLDDLEQIFYDEKHLDILFNKLIKNSNNSEMVTQILELLQQIFTSFTSLNKDQEDQNVYGNFDHDDDEVVVDDQENNDKFPFQYFAQKIKQISDLITLEKIKERGIFIQNSIKNSQISIGEGNYNLIEFLLTCLKSKEETIQDATIQSNFFKNTAEIFKNFPLNSLVQSLFDKILTTVLKQENNQIIKAFFTQTNLIPYMFQNYEKKQQFPHNKNFHADDQNNNQSKKIFEMNLGQKGFLNKFIEQIQDDLKKNETLKEFIQEKHKADWDDLLDLVKNDPSLPKANYEWGQIFDEMYPEQARYQNQNDSDSDDFNNHGRYSNNQSKHFYENFMRSDNPNFIKKDNKSDFFESSSSEEEIINNNSNSNNENNEMETEEVIQRYTADNINNLAQESQLHENNQIHDNLNQQQQIQQEINQQQQENQQIQEEKEKEREREENAKKYEGIHFLEIEYENLQRDQRFEGSIFK